MRRALVTGGAGFIGSHLVEHLLAVGQEVYVIDDLSTGRPENLAAVAQHPYVHVDYDSVLNEELLDTRVVAVDAVYHLAASVGVKLIVSNLVTSVENNVRGTEAVLQAASRHGTKVLLTSTSEVYGRSNNGTAFLEKDDLRMGPPTSTRWSYACSKALDEYLAFAYLYEKNLPVTVVRLFNTVGERQTASWGMVIPSLVQQALADLPLTIYGDGQQSRCFCYVGDVVRALHRLMEHPASVGEVYNLGSTQAVTIVELADRILALTGSNSQKTFVPYQEAYSLGFDDIDSRLPDIGKASALVDFTPRVSLDEIIHKVAAELRQTVSQPLPSS